MSYLYVMVLMIEFEKRRFMKKYMTIKKRVTTRRSGAITKNVNQSDKYRTRYG